MRRDPEMQSWEGHQTFASENLGSLGSEKPLVEHKEAYLFSGKSRKFPQQYGDTLSIYHDKMGELANRILNILQEYFNIENPQDNQFDSHCADATTRITYYHPLDEGKMKDPNITWCGGHYDTSPFALLPKATATGLQLKRKGEWINIDVPDDTIILNTGRLFKFFTANLIKPRYHRVVADEKSALTGRYSIIFFPCWPPNFEVRPMPSCLKLASQGMDQEEKIRFQKEFLIGAVDEIMPIYDAIAANIKVSKDQIKKWKEKYPDNPLINAKWPDEDNIE